MAGKSVIILILVLLVASCASMGERDARDERPMKQLTVGHILDSDMERIDLRRNMLVCAGRKVEMLDKVEGVLVKGILCEENRHMSFLYLFNDEPFFFAITSINETRDELTPRKGFAAIEKKKQLKLIDLKNSKPRLPRWAHDAGGKPIESIYTEEAGQTGRAPEMDVWQPGSP